MPQLRAHNALVVRGHHYRYGIELTNDHRVPRQRHRERAIYEALRDLIDEYETVVYFARTEGNLIKIGCTGSLRERRRSLAIDFTDILAVIPGGFADESAYHRQFAEYLAHGNEWFHPGPALIEFINEYRANAGVDPITLS